MPHDRLLFRCKETYSKTFIYNCNILAEFLQFWCWNRHNQTMAHIVQRMMNFLAKIRQKQFAELPEIWQLKGFFQRPKTALEPPPPLCSTTWHLSDGRLARTVVDMVRFIGT